MTTKKILPAPLKREEPEKQQDLFNRKGNIHRAVEFLNEHYTIKIPACDPEKMIVECKNPNRYRDPPTFKDIHLHFVDECDVSISKAILSDILTSTNYIKPYDPIRLYLDSIRGKYAGESHIDLLCSFLKFREFNPSQPTYSQERSCMIIKKWFVSSIAQWLGDKDDDHNPVMLTFIQPNEGFGKTTLCEFIIPEILKSYSTKSLQFRDKNRFDFEDSFTRYAFIMYDELVGLHKSTIDLWKSLLTSKKIDTRRRNERVAVKRKRIAIALGSTNKNQEKGGFLGDNFDTRRYGCIELDDILHEYRECVDVDQLWAEALMLYESSDFRWKFDREDFAEFEVFNLKYTVETDAIRYAHIYLAHPLDDEDGEWMNALEIINDMRKNRLIKREHSTFVTPRNLGIALTSLGYDSKKTRNGLPVPLKRYYIKRLYNNNI